MLFQIRNFSPILRTFLFKAKRVYNLTKKYKYGKGLNIIINSWTLTPKEPLKANEVQYFSEEEFLSQYSKILSIASNLTSPSYKPQAYILGGQPGSGKTNLHRKILIMHSTNVFLINGDDFRKYHPNFSKIQQRNADSIA